MNNARCMVLRPYRKARAALVRRVSLTWRRSGLRKHPMVLTTGGIWPSDSQGSRAGGPSITHSATHPGHARCNPATPMMTSYRRALFGVMAVSTVASCECGELHALLCGDLRILSLPPQSSVGPQVNPQIQADFAGAAMTAPPGHGMCSFIPTVASLSRTRCRASIRTTWRCSARRFPSERSGPRGELVEIPRIGEAEARTNLSYRLAHEHR